MHRADSRRAFRHAQKTHILPINSQTAWLGLAPAASDFLLQPGFCLLLLPPASSPAAEVSPAGPRLLRAAHGAEHCAIDWRWEAVHAPPSSLRLVGCAAAPCLCMTRDQRRMSHVLVPSVLVCCWLALRRRRALPLDPQPTTSKRIEMSRCCGPDARDPRGGSSQFTY